VTIVSFKDEVDTELEIADLQTAVRQISKLRRENSILKSALNSAETEAEIFEDRARLITNLSSSELNPPKWLSPTRPGKGHRGTVVAMLSDTHFDEVVNPHELGGLNAYNREIATQRLQRWAEGIIKVARHYLQGVTYDGAVVMLGGDIFTGNLHDLQETNEDTIFGSLLYWSEQIAAALAMIAEEFGKLHVPVVVGNHGRITKKPRTKLRARDNLDYLLGQLLARQLQSDSITFDIPENTDAWVKVYNTTHLLSHGDQTTGGGGIGGIWSPIMRMSARKAQRYAAEGKTFETLCIGHWHQLIMGHDQGICVNGSLKGYDEFAAVCNFRPERPQQAMWIVTPERGITVSAPVLVADRKKEKW
jgi:hypothetical protein